MKKNNELLWYGFIGAGVFTLIMCVLTIVVGNNFSLFVRDGVTYDLLDLAILSSRWTHTKTYLANATYISALITGILGVINLAKELWISFKKNEAQ